MSAVDLSGATASGSAVAATLLISNKGQATPPSNIGHISSYSDGYTAGTSGSVFVPPISAPAPNAGVKWSPFLRGYVKFTTTDFVNVGITSLNITYPVTCQPGDLVVLFVANALTVTPPSNWTSISTVGTEVIWTHVVTAGEPGATVTGLIGGSRGAMVYIGPIYGNATAGRVLHSTSLTSAGTIATAPTITVNGGDGVCFMWRGSTSAQLSAGTYTMTGIGVRDFVPVFFPNNGQTGVADAFPASATTYSGVRMTSATVTMLSASSYTVELLGLTVFPYADVTLEEAVGADQDTQAVADSVTLLGADAHSDQAEYGYALLPLEGGGTVHSYERWVRLRFDPAFNTVQAIRFWLPTAIPPGWTVKYGLTSDYATPVNTSSSIATNLPPTSDPGRLASNISGTDRLIGTETRYTDWIVLQATVDTATAGAGPIRGFSVEGTLLPIELRFSWIET